MLGMHWIFQGRRAAAPEPREATRSLAEEQRLHAERTRTPRAARLIPVLPLLRN